MTGHTSWRDALDQKISRDPEAFAAWERAKAELDAKWEIECRYGNCVIFVSPDSAEGPDQDDGWGPIDCPCKANDDARYYLAHKDDEDEWG